MMLYATPEKEYYYQALDQSLWALGKWPHTPTMGRYLFPVGYPFRVPRLPKDYTRVFEYSASMAKAIESVESAAQALRGRGV